MSTAQPSKNLMKTYWHMLVRSPAWPWIQKSVVLVAFSLVINHIAARDNFLDGASYRFPLEGFLFTIVFCFVVGIIADINFKSYKKKYFSKKVEASSIFRFLASTMGYVSIFYIPVNIIVELAIGGQVNFYFVFIGLVITLLICTIFVSILYAKDLYNLYKISIKDAEITIDSGAKTTKVSYENILCFYTENKIVYTIKKDGSTIITDFTLNDLEEAINDQLFFRANRKIIINKDAVGEVEKIENGKLVVRLKKVIENDKISEINISRYKRKSFLEWFQ